MNLSISGLAFLVFWFIRFVVAPIVAAIVPRKHRDEQVAACRLRSYIQMIQFCLIIAGIALIIALLNQVPVLGSWHFDLKTVLFASAFLGDTAQQN